MIDTRFAQAHLLICSGNSDNHCVPKHRFAAKHKANNSFFKCESSRLSPTNLGSALHLLLLVHTFSGDFQGLVRITPVSGPAEAAGTAVTFYGHGFINTSSLACRFGYAPPVPATFVSPNELFCESPPLVVPTTTPENDPGGADGLTWSALSEIRQRDADPLTGSNQLFPGAHFFPLFLQRAVGVEVGCFPSPSKIFPRGTIEDSLFVRRGPIPSGVSMACFVVDPICRWSACLTDRL